MAQFDPLKAAREELTGLADVMATLRQRENAAEAAMGQAEQELNAIRKLRGFCEIEMLRLRERIRKLEEAATPAE